MEEETDGGRNSDKSLPKFLFHLSSDNLFYVWACFGVVVLFELGQYCVGEQAQT